MVAGSGYGSSLSFSYPDNRVTTSGFTYDNSGNVTNANLGATFSYDAESFIITAGGTVSYKRDAQGRRVRKTVGSTVTDYFYVGAEIITEKTGSVWTDYIFFGGQRIAKQTGGTLSTATFIHTDHLGSARRCTDSNGNLNGTCDYEPFGEFTGGASACTVPTDFRFAGLQFDSETSLYSTWFRQYDPSQGRWMGVDPLSGAEDGPQSLNRYVYVLNDPVNLVDPLGLCEIEVEAAIVCAIVLGRAEGCQVTWYVTKTRCGGGGGEREGGGERRGDGGGGGGAGGGPGLEGTLHNFAQLQLNWARQNLITDCEAMLRVFGAAFSLFGKNVHGAVDAVARTFTELDVHSATGAARTGARRTTVGVYAPTTFLDTGYKSEYRDGGNQVRHFVGSFAAAFEGWEQIVGAWVRNVFDDPADRRLGLDAIDFGSGLRIGGAVNKTLAAIRKRICQD